MEKGEKKREKKKERKKKRNGKADERKRRREEEEWKCVLCLGSDWGAGTSKGNVAKVNVERKWQLVLLQLGPGGIDRRGREHDD